MVHIALAECLVGLLMVLVITAGMVIHKDMDLINGTVIEKLMDSCADQTMIAVGSIEDFTAKIMILISHPVGHGLEETLCRLWANVLVLVATTFTIMKCIASKSSLAELWEW